MGTVNVNVVRGRSYEKFSTQKFVIWKFYNMKTSRSTVVYLKGKSATHSNE